MLLLPYLPKCHPLLLSCPGLEKEDGDGVEEELGLLRPLLPFLIQGVGVEEAAVEVSGKTEVGTETLSAWANRLSLSCGWVGPGPPFIITTTSTIATREQ